MSPLLRLLAAVAFLAAMPPASACFECNLYFCGPALGGGRQQCRQTCAGGAGDPALNCVCVIFGYFCYGARGPDWLPNYEPEVAELGKGASSFGQASSLYRRLVSAIDEPKIPSGCSQRRTEASAVIVECGVPLPSNSPRVILNASLGDLLQISEVDKDIAAVLARLVRSSKIDPMPTVEMQMSVDKAWSAESVRAFILGAVPRQLLERPIWSSYSISFTHQDDRWLEITIAQSDTAARSVVARFKGSPESPQAFALTSWSMR